MFLEINLQTWYICQVQPEEQNSRKLERDLAYTVVETSKASLKSVKQGVRKGRLGLMGMG